ncbi:hypothetical protein C8Q77DRAFT_1272687 [Trametes polyzona]|nr:hypothetical protein C8Q77DRAFT_1272687 [Trametes polyzona]
MAHKATRHEPREFMLHFFPLPSDPPLADNLATDAPSTTNPDVPQWDRSVLEELRDAEDLLEVELSERFIDVIEGSGVLSARLKMAESQHPPDTTDETKQKIDAAFLRSQRAPDDGRPHWADQMVAVEFKRGANDTDRDPFDDRDDSKVDASAEGRKAVRGQLIDYAENIFRYQHRTALFMLVIIGRRCRFLRWDRSGTLVTRSMDYYENHQLFLEMLWRMSNLTDEQLGCDPSATRIYPRTAEYHYMEKLSLPDVDDLDHTERTLQEIPSSDRVFRYVRDMFCTSLEKEWPRYKLEVVHGGKKYHFLVGKPVFYALGMAGRGTRGFVAWDCQRKRFVWLKDAWRVHYELVDQEGAILRELNAKGVSYVPTVYCHGDVLNQTTQTPKYWEMKNSSLSGGDRASQAPRQDSSRTLVFELTASSRTLANSQPSVIKGRKRSLAETNDEANENAFSPSGLYPEGRKRQHNDDCPLRRHMHYRLVVDEVAMPLKDFRSGSQLVSIIRDCVIAHDEALKKAGVMHRDVAQRSDSTTLRMTWTGMLADWELSKLIVAEGEMPRARQPERTGTWQFMSAATLNDHGKAIEVADELESFVHVLLYYGVRYLRSNCKDVGAFIEDYFDSHHYTNGKYLCGKKKKEVVQMGQGLTLEGQDDVILEFVSAPLNSLIETLLVRVHAHYVVEAFKAYETTQVQQPSALAPALPVHPPPSEEDDFEEEVREIYVSPSVTPEEKVAERNSKAKGKPAQPTSEQVSAAPKASSHSAMCFLMAEVLRTRGWRKDRVAGDNVPADYIAQRPRAPAERPGKASIKRVKTEAHTLGALRDRAEVSMAIKPPPTKYGTDRL